jgi:hypothetical protein
MSSKIKNKYIAFVYTKLTVFMLFWYVLSLIITYFKGKRELPAYSSIKDLYMVVSRNNSMYKDTKYLLLSHPRHIQYNIEKNNFIGDCDNHSLYWCSSIIDSRLAKKAWLCIYHMERDGKLMGHSVCAYQDFSDRYFYFDYKYPKEIKNIEDWMCNSGKTFGAEPICGLMFQIGLFNNSKFPKLKGILKVLPKRNEE